MQASGYEVLLNVDNVRRLLEGLLMTLNVSLVSVALSLPLGVLFGMVMRINNPVTKIASRTYLEFIRIMPQLVLLLSSTSVLRAVSAGTSRPTRVRSLSLRPGERRKWGTS